MSSGTRFKPQGSFDFEAQFYCIECLLYPCVCIEEEILQSSWLYYGLDNALNEYFRQNGEWPIPEWNKPEGSNASTQPRCGVGGKNDPEGHPTENNGPNGR